MLIDRSSFPERRPEHSGPATGATIAIHEDGRVVVQVPRTEMGQGIHTGLAMVVAEELDIPFDERISVEFPTEPLPAYSSLSRSPRKHCQNHSIFQVQTGFFTGRGLSNDQR
ncbi:molybdopterin cofactor-binding domain-containing protein [Mesorhizobium sp. CAU 1732]|uniref:molybdopterin cofactor-binding domain-containing protein n=1 Tax=Mesorhizobium sp. CAU 1732 TaxID=3140358 RepID=UPI003261594E